jgi:membrane protease YdiL (CAAX protease family)
LGAVVVVFVALAPFLLVEALQSKSAGEASAGPSVEERVQQFRPKLEALLEFDALADPIYVLLAITLLSFVTAGLREELWRAGFMAAVRDLLPRSWWIPRPRKPSEPWLRWQLRRRGPTLLVAGLAAVVFGLGHLPQGIGGVVLTGVVGFILALVMIGHRSLWAAVIAHGFFDASTFVLLAVIVWNKEWIQRMAPDVLKQLGM